MEKAEIQGVENCSVDVKRTGKGNAPIAGAVFFILFGLPWLFCFFGLIVFGLIVAVLVPFVLVILLFLLGGILFCLPILLLGKAIDIMIPSSAKRYVSSLIRLASPKCPVCEEGRLKITIEEICTYDRRGGAGKLFYGMKSHTKCTDNRRTTSCDRCNYEISEEYTIEGGVFVV